MNAFPLVVLVALSTPPQRAEEMDLDAPMKAARVALDSPELHGQILAAMALPYKYGVTQMPCKAQQWQPRRGWRPAREPAGRIQWVVGPVTKVFWSGIYGTCLIQSPVAREEAKEIERISLECECNGWLPGK